MSGTSPRDREVLDGVDQLVEELRTVCGGRDSRVVLISLEEMYGRVLSAHVTDPEHMEDWVGKLTQHVRGWWIADRGGQFLPS